VLGRGSHSPVRGQIGAQPGTRRPGSQEPAAVAPCASPASSGYLDALPGTGAPLDERYIRSPYPTSICIRRAGLAVGASGRPRQNDWSRSEPPVGWPRRFEPVLEHVKVAPGAAHLARQSADVAVGVRTGVQGHPLDPDRVLEVDAGVVGWASIRSHRRCGRDSVAARHRPGTEVRRSDGADFLHAIRGGADFSRATGGRQREEAT
jgi:hypothetical protein